MTTETDDDHSVTSSAGVELYQRPIAHLLTPSSFPSTAANSVQVVHVANALDRLGFSVTLHGYRATGFDQAAIRRQYNLGRNVELRVRPHHKNRVVRFVDLLGTMLSVGRENPAICYTRDPVMAFFAPRGRRGVVCELHALPEPGSLTAFFLRLLTRRSPRHVALVFITRAIQDAMQSRFPRVGRFRHVVAPSGVDVDAFAGVAPALPSPGRGRLRIGYVGSLYEGRGIETVLHCARTLPDEEFLIVGGSEAEWQTVSAGEGLPNVRRLPHQPAAAVPALLRSCDVLLAPYQHTVRTHGGVDTASWMSPLKVFEYMASGAAIIASNLPPLREVLSHRRNAVLVTAEDPDAWVRAIAGLASDAQIRATLGAGAAADAAQHYSWLIRTRRILATLDVDEGRPRSRS